MKREASPLLQGHERVEHIGVDPRLACRENEARIDGKAAALQVQFLEMAAIGLAICVQSPQSLDRLATMVAAMSLALREARGLEAHLYVPPEL